MKPYPLVLLYWIVFFLCGWQAKAQPQYQEKIDSLLIVLRTVPEDTNKIKIYGDLSYNYAGTRTELDLAHAYADSMRLLSEKLGYEQGIIQSHMYYGFCDRYQGNYTDALMHFQIYIDYHKKIGDELMEARGWFQIATVHQELGNYEQSLAACEYTLKINEKNEHWNGVVATLNSIGIIYKITGKNEQAIACYQKAIAINDSFNLNRDLTYILMNTGNSYSELKEYDKALNYYQQSLNICYAANNEYGIASNLLNSGSVYHQMKQYHKALDFHLQALRILEKSPNKTRLASSLIETGYTYVKLNRFSLAKKHLEEGVALAKELNAKALIRDAYRHLTELYATANDYQQAYEFDKLYYAMKDSIFSEDNVKQINELQTKYETAEKDKQIALLAKEKEIQAKEVQRQATLKRAFVGGLIAVIMLVSLGVLILRQRLKNQKLLAGKNEEIKEVNFKRQLSELEMKALRAQINPHFLFNCMNSINRMILNGETEDASRYLAKFSKLVRLILENSEAPTVSLENELAMLESYIQLEALRFKGKINYQIVLDEAIEPESTYLPSMVLQPFVENAIWHGLMHKETEDKGMITIAIREDEDRLLCTIEDNGVGREKANTLQEKSVLKSTSMGMKITEERLRLLSKKQLEQLIRITDLKDAMNFALGTRVEINIPIS